MAKRHSSMDARTIAHLQLGLAGINQSRGKHYFRCTHFPLSYVSKITQKKHSVSHKIMMKRAIVLIFCRNMLLDSLQRQLKWFG